MTYTCYQYIWQIKSYCDSLGNTSSQWSTVDSFFTENSALTYPTGIYANNITFYNAQVNWIGANNTDRFKIRYRIFGTTSWNYLSNIAGFLSSTQLPQLNQLTLYEWSIMSYYDTTIYLVHFGHRQIHLPQLSLFQHLFPCNKHFN